MPTWKKYAKADDAILKSLLTEQGDIIYASAASTPAALPHGTSSQYLKSGGDAANPSWDTPAGGAVITSGSYTGNGATNRAIPHGLARAPKVILIGRSTGSALWRIINGLAKVMYLPGSSDVGAVSGAVTAMDSTNFYVGDGVATRVAANFTNDVYYWVALG